jgi:hypothetical protein
VIQDKIPLTGADQEGRLATADQVKKKQNPNVNVLRKVLKGYDVLK